MLKSKSQWTCLYCSKILKDPIELPCDHSICGQHLSEKSVIKENKIKCFTCKAEFKVKGNDFKSNEFSQEAITAIRSNFCLFHLFLFYFKNTIFTFL